MNVGENPTLTGSDSGSVLDNDGTAVPTSGISGQNPEDGNPTAQISNSVVNTRSGHTTGKISSPSGTGIF